MTFWTELLGRTFSVGQRDVAGVDTRVLTTGQGEPVLFLHGISGHLEAFLPVVPFLCENYELHLIDMLGHGYTAKPGGDITIDRLADHAIAYMDSCNIDKAHVVGLSLGGWVAGWLVAHYPDRFFTGTLIAAAGNPAMGRPEIGEHVRRITKAGVDSDDREDTVARVRAVMYKPESADDEIVDVRYGIYHMPEFRANIDGLLALTHSDTYNRFALTPELLAGVKCEVLLVWGEDDANSGVADADFLIAHLPKTRLVQMAQTGHWPPYERPKDFASLAGRFFARGLVEIESGRQ